MNKQARKNEYLEQNSKQGMTILKGGGASSYMFATGAVVLGFVILHLIDFTFELRGAKYYPESEYEKAKLLLSNPVSAIIYVCLLYTSPSPRDQRGSRMPSSA